MTKKLGTGKIAQLLRARAAHPEDLGSKPNTHAAAYNVCNPPGNLAPSRRPYMQTKHQYT